MLEPRLSEPRLPEPYGQWIDRTQAITFSFEGQAYSGFQGDTIASRVQHRTVPRERNYQAHSMNITLHKLAVELANSEE